MKRRLILLLLAALPLALLCACGAPKEYGPPPDLTGNWIQSGELGSFYQVATIEGDEIELYWHLTADDSEYLYWAGTFTPPETGEEPYVWVSENDYSKTSLSTRGRKEETLTFTYEKGRISFISIMAHLHMTVSLERVEEEPA